jgi:hypothetical protein
MKFNLKPNAKDWVYSEPQSTFQVGCNFNAVQSQLLWI